MVRGQISSSSTQITLKTRKSTGLSRLTSLGKAHPMMSQDQRRAIARLMTKVCLEDLYLTSFRINIPFSRSRKGGYWRPYRDEPGQSSPGDLSDHHECLQLRRSCPQVAGSSVKWERRGIIFLFSCFQRGLQGILDRTSQHGHRVLFPRAFVLNFLWPRQWRFLQIQPRMELDWDSFRGILWHNSSLRNKSSV